jgi:CRISPR type I-D-associated protein Csc2
VITPAEFEQLKPYFVEELKPIAGVKTIQLVVMREVLDYTVLRTEEDRQLNYATTVASATSDKQVGRALFLGSKQKAVESRQLERLLRTAAAEADVKIEECYLKDHLCLECPRCGLYGGTNASSQKSTKANIKHRIGYSSAFSVESLDEVSESITFNAIDQRTQTTGQALGERVSVTPGALFPSVITLTSVTWKELVLVIKTLLSSKKYGAEARIGGDVRNHIVGIAAGWEELVTPMELTLNLAEEEDYPKASVHPILDRAVNETGHPEKIKILSEEEMQTIVDMAREHPLDKSFLEEAFKDIRDFRKIQES